MQYFFVDESGDPGLNISKSSPYYVLAMVQLARRESIAELARLRRDLRLPPNFEFHYYRMRAKQKEQFFQVIQPLNFHIRAAALIKSDASIFLRNVNHSEIIPDLLTKLTLRASPMDIKNDVLVLDNVSESFLQALRIYFTLAYKQEKRERPFKKFTSSDSRSEDGLQIADMVAGAIRQYVWEQDATYYRMFSAKIKDLWLVK